MNEVLGPLYYVFAQDSDESWAEHAEADTYYCFQNLMSEIKDNFIKTLDQSNCGIGTTFFHGLSEVLHDLVFFWETLGIRYNIFKNQCFLLYPNPSHDY